MSKGKTIFGIIAIVIIAFLLFTLTSPILIIAEDTTEGSPGIDMAAKFSVLGGFDWIYPGSSVNENGQTLHNVHQDSPDDPYGAARDIMTYTYQFTPHIIVSVNPEAAEGTQRRIQGRHSADQPRPAGREAAVRERCRHV